MSSSMVRLEPVPLPIIISMVCRHTTTCETGYAGETVYEDDPVDEGIRWLRGSRCWGERYGRGDKAPGPVYWHTNGQ